MTKFRNLFTATLVVLIAACGNGSDARQAATPAADPAPAPIAAVELQTETTAPAVVEENIEPTAAAETIVLAQADTDAAPAESTTWKFSEGQHYISLTTAQGTSSPPDVIEVAEVFWYGCPHCYNFDPFLKSWQPTLPASVKFVRLPVMWNPTNKIHARVFYTAEALGKLDEIHEAIFREIHINKKALTEESDIQDFFGNYDVSAEEFQNTFRSFAVESKLKRAANLTKRYRIQSVPLLVVNGKFLTSGPGIKNFDDMLAVADELIEREQQ